MPVDEAVLETPVNVEPVEPVEVAEPEPVEPEPVEEVRGDERVLKQWMRDLKGTNPEAFKEIKALTFGKKALDEKLKDFDLDGTKTFLEEHGGREALAAQLQETAEKVQALDNINNAVMQGNPAIAKMMRESSPEGFAKIAPAVLSEWAQSDPDAWAASMSGVMAATINQAGIPAFLDRMELMLQYNDTTSFAASLKQLKEWAGSFQQRASAPVAAQPGKPQPNVQQERQTWEQEKFGTDLATAEDAQRTPLIEQELAQYIARRPNDADAKELAVSNLKTQVEQRMKNDAEYQKSRAAFIGRKDRDGALRLAKSRESIAIKELATKVGKAIYGAVAAPKPATPAPRPALPSVPARTADKFDAIWGR